MTVTNVLRGRTSQVSEATRKRVVKAIHDLNYVPVRSALQNRRNETRIVGLVPCRADLFSHMLDARTYPGLVRIAVATSYDLLLMLRSESEWVSLREDARFLDRRCDGFIFVSTARGEWDETLVTLTRHEIPTVVCYRRDVPSGIAWVDPDNDQIVELAIDTLRKLGHRRIGYLLAPPSNPYDPQRLANLSTSIYYDDEMRQSAFTKVMLSDKDTARFARCFIPGAQPDWSVHDSAIAFVKKHRLTAAITGSGFLGLLLWERARANAVRVPHELSILSVDEHANGGEQGLGLVLLDYEDIGEAAMRAFTRLVSGAAASDVSTIVPARSVAPGKTVAKPPA